MPKTYDLIIRDAEVFDGKGSAPVRGDIGLEGDRIADLGTLQNASAETELDAAGRALCPGFIDVHTHDDFAALAHPDMGFKSRGGVTTCIVGNCGFGAAPFAAANAMLGNLTPGFDYAAYEGHAGYGESLADQGTGINIGVLAGHGTFRMAAVGRGDRSPTDREMAEMKAFLREALDAGVFGMSSGLIYEPGKYADTQELTELAGVMRDTGALYASHIRDEGAGLLDAVQEAIAIGAGANVPVQISHHKAMGEENWGLVERSLRLIETAQARGEDVHADQYPYTAGSTSLQAVLANGAFADDASKGGFATIAGDSVVVASCPGFAHHEGQTMTAISRELGLSLRQAAETLVARAPGTTAILHMMSEQDVQTVLRHPSTMIGSDGIPTLDGKPHPRLYNTFARVLGHYARDLGVFDLPTAIYRMCGMPARKFGLVGRGVIEQGAYADLVLFDRTSILDKGTMDNPNQYPTGIDLVVVNGKIAVQDGVVADERNGRVLKRRGL